MSRPVKRPHRVGDLETPGEVFLVGPDGRPKFGNLPGFFPAGTTRDLLEHTGTGFESRTLAQIVRNAALDDDTVVIGDSATADNTGQIAIGSRAAASGLGAISIGPDSSAGQIGTAIGGFADAGEQGTAVGRSADATGLQSVAVGFSSTASAGGAIAIGVASNGVGPSGISIGNATSAGDHAVAIGGGCVALDNQIKIAAGTTEVEFSSTAVGAAVGATATDFLNLVIEGVPYSIQLLKA